MWAVYIELEDGTPELVASFRYEGQADKVVRSGRYGEDAWTEYLEMEESEDS